MKEHIGHHGVNIAKALSSNLAYQHLNVRKITLESLCALILTDDGGSLLEHVMAGLKLII